MANLKFIKVLLVIAGALFLVFIGVFIYSVEHLGPGLKPLGNWPGELIPGLVNRDRDIQSAGLTMERFASEQEFKDYLEKASELGRYYGGFGGGVTRSLAVEEVAFDSSAPNALAQKAGLTGETAPTPDRVSTTNVQVVGIDEPDILKTDGKQIYYSPSTYYYARPIPLIDVEDSRGTMPPYQYQNNVKVVKAFPPADLENLADIEGNGNLLIYKNILLLFTGEKIIGYDVSNPSAPTEKWQVKLQDNYNLVQARLYGDKLYLVSQSYISYGTPCPIRPLQATNKELVVNCTDIYHPSRPVNIDVTYTATIINPLDGSLQASTSFVGSNSSSVVYMSPQALYITYAYSTDMAEFMFKFFSEEMTDIVDAQTISKLSKLASYDISNQSKISEITIVLEQFYNSLSEDDRLKLENEMENRLNSYLAQHQRELSRSGIVKIGLDNFAVLATGDVAGQPLNQFSLDEYQGYLRVATTIGRNFFLGTNSESVSDVNVLDGDLKTVSSVTDLGRGERIYSVRFIQDKGYVVTFRQIDPFYVLDLSNPKQAALKGELKIPGYSSYLHPITKDKIIGIGQENSKVKVSLFDVSRPDNPVEADKYVLDEYWSDVLNTHHAFLLDDKHGVFFMPGGRGGYIFAYSGDKLRLERAVSDIVAKRAIYLDDYMYIVGDDKIVVLNENDWQRVNELEF